MTSNAPLLVSVLMPVYNAARFLPQAIQSILDQSFRDFELLLFDDGSSDESARILHAYASDPRVRIFERSHRGYTALLNEGIQRAHGTFIARMDTDDVALPDRFVLQLDHLDRHPETLAVGGQVLLVDEDGDPLGPLRLKLSHEEIEDELLQGRGSALVHPTAMFRKQALVEVGCYREEYHGAEDLDLYLRLAERGRLANVPQRVLHFRRHADSVSAQADPEAAERRRARIVHAAYRRRGLAEDQMRIRRYPAPGCREELYTDWIDSALAAGYFRTAFKYTRRLVRAKPLAAGTWIALGRLYARQVARWLPMPIFERLRRLRGRECTRDRDSRRFVSLGKFDGSPEQGRKLRIAVFCSRFPVVSETFVVNHVVQLLRQGHDVEILAQAPGEAPESDVDIVQLELAQRTFYWPHRPHNPLARVLKGLGLWLVHLPRAPRVMLGALNAFRYGRRALSFDLVYGATAWLARPRYDLVHCHFGPAGRLTATLKAIGALDAPLIVTWHGTDAAKALNEPVRSGYAQMFRTIDLCTVGSEFMRERVLALGAQADQVVCVPMGVDLERFTFHPRQMNAGESRDVRLITVARLIEVKGIETALRALQIALGRFGRLHYEIVGTGPLREALEELSQQLGIRRHVTFAGALPHDQVIGRLRQADLFVLPSLPDRRGAVEGQGLALVEAEACGLPVVASRVGGIPASVPPENHQWLVPPGDPASLADKLCQLAQHPELWGEIGRAGRGWVEAHFDARRLAERLEQIYVGLTFTSAGGQPPQCSQPQEAALV